MAVKYLPSELITRKVINVLTDTSLSPGNNTKPALFPPTHWKYVLQLLGLIIVADKRVLKEEVDTYLDVVSELRVTIDPTISLTRHMALDWFTLNKSDLQDVIENLAYDTVLLETLSAIKSMPHKLDVISAMVRIAVSDGEYSNVERGLIKKTILYWNISANCEDELDYSDVETLRNLSEA